MAVESFSMRVFSRGTRPTSRAMPRARMLDQLSEEQGAQPLALEVGTALAAKDHRPEHAVDAGTDDELLRMRAAHRGLYGKAVDPCCRPGGTRRIEDSSVESVSV